MPYTILVADDATMNRMLIKEILKNSLKSIEIKEAVNGKEVMDIVAKENIDLIILDLIMPVQDGYETLKQLKKSKKYYDIPVIVNSAITEIKSIEQTLKEGAIDYFTKPLSQDDINIILPLKAKNAIRMYEQNKTIVELNHHIHEELKNANAFTNIMLPHAGRYNPIELFIKFEPSLGVGGDFFDCVEKDGRIHFMVADVTGHGIAAGMASSMVKILYRKAIEKDGVFPHEILENINQSIFDIFDFAGEDNYLVFTAFVGVIEKNTLYFSNAGQPYPVVFRHEKNEFEVLEENGFLVGMLEEVTFDLRNTHLGENDHIFLYTDGLFCADEGNDFTGWTKVFSLCNQFKKDLVVHPNQFLDEIFYAFHMIHKSKQRTFNDDVAMMVLKYKSLDD